MAAKPRRLCPCVPLCEDERELLCEVEVREDCPLPPPCEARPPLAAISRRSSGSIAANPLLLVEVFLEVREADRVGKERELVFLAVCDCDLGMCNLLRLMNGA